ncbi:DUF2513 domain-containing protein [Bacillus gobiensis]|uniref:DUF2513 domain-containing protein n=1 Tax=Bacillus gobiensis TaxID=1441095 RepID=UPI003D23931F
MERDMDLIREILVQTKENEFPFEIKVEGKSEKEIMYHVGLMKDEGLIEANEYYGNGYIDYNVTKLTPLGHHFINKVI